MTKGMLNICRAIVIILFIVGVVIIGVYPAPNQDLHLVFESSDKKVMVSLPETEITNNQAISISIPEANLEVEEVLVYRIFKTVRLQTIKYNELASYIQEVSNGSMQVENNSIILSGADKEKIEFTLNENGSKALRELSGSLLMERLFVAELWMLICVIALVCLTIIKEKRDTLHRDNHGPIQECKRFFRDIKEYWQYMNYAAKADLKAEVSNSYLNRLWWILEPFFSMLVYVIVFGKLLGSSIENYSCYIFASLLMWSYFSKILNHSVKLVRSHRDILTKVYVPKYVLLISNMILNFYKLMFSMIVLVAMIIIFRVTISWTIIWMIPCYVVMMLLAFGFGMILLHYGVFVDDLSYAVGILLNMIMYLSGIFYDPITGLSYPLNILMISLNPAAMFITGMREALLYSRVTCVPLIVLWFFISVIIAYIGVHIVYKNENSYAKVV